MRNHLKVVTFRIGKRHFSQSRNTLSGSLLKEKGGYSRSRPQGMQ